MIAPDGYTYNRAAITRHLEAPANGERSPHTGEPMQASELRADRLAEKRITHRADYAPDADESDAASTTSSVCDPITFEVFEDPVTASDGHTYNLHDLARWYERDGRSPFTRERLSPWVYPNRAIQAELAARGLVVHGPSATEPSEARPAGSGRRRTEVPRRSAIRRTQARDPLEQFDGCGLVRAGLYCVGCGLGAGLIARGVIHSGPLLAGIVGVLAGSVTGFICCDDSDDMTSSTAPHAEARGVEAQSLER